ncbi:choice-of-anchor I family protein [Orrella dioscoreae]|uniref:Alkaline phosphatase n=1 Tax=Orrella dioscoreae TaxID=1851544 RepID=A0A1C3K597_9BURK|nr:choice-of-anchor I family protein [Orrella dioscoreae]SBT26690.1 Alkaline phosphatase [Orrella dioscoreae]SOE49419.1 Alkaline phosphatase [Orrella dioscoreae]
MSLPSRFRLARCAHAVAACSLALTLAACGSSNDDEPASTPPAVEPTPTPVPTPVPTPSSVKLSLLSRYQSGEFGVSAAEIPAYDAASKRAFVVNARKGSVDVLDMSDAAAPRHLGEIDASAVAAGAEVNSVAVKDGVVALAIQAADKTDPGFVGFYRADTLAPLTHVVVGALPDNLVFTPDGKTVLVANEGEPSDDYQRDPEGSISIIDVSNIARPGVRTARFAAWDSKEQELRDQGVRIFGPRASASKDLEPEYIAVSADSKTAWATLQENNALARIDIETATVTAILPLGFKDHGVAGNGMDTNDEDQVIDIRERPGVMGMYMPDAMAAYDVSGKTFLVTANEGDARAWGEDMPAYWGTSATPGDVNLGFVEEFRVKHLVHNSGFARRRGDDLPPQLDALATRALLNPATFGYCGAMTIASGGTSTTSGDCREDEELGRLNVTWTMGYRADATGAPVKFNATGAEDPAGTLLMYDKLYSFGARSFAIWGEDGKKVWESGDQFERFLASDACQLGAARNIPCKTYFNSGHDEGGAMDSRSDAKGPEPEGIELGRLGDKTFAFIGLERMGGVMVYDVSTPTAPVFVDYFNTREDWDTADPSTVLSTVGDLGPEGLKFISPPESPTGEALLVVGNEVSGTTAIYTVGQLFEDSGDTAAHAQ